MSGPTPTSPTAAKARAGIPKTVWDLVFTFVIPILVLSPNILGSGISVADLLGGGSATPGTIGTGNVRAYVLAALIPVAYVIWDLVRNRTLSPVAMIGGAGAIFSGALAFWFVDGFWFAIKDSARSYLVGVLFLISAATSVPLLRVFLDAASVGESPEHRAATQQAMRDPGVHRALALGTVVFAGVDLLGGVINSVVNYARVTAKFGTDDFNAQVAAVNAIMRIPGLIVSLAGIAIAFWIVQRAVQARYGQGASLLEPAKLEAVMRERGELGAVQRAEG
ncbi:VC0807 family protein [uncultured Deinococcus sp.]|uniref:VC0807 family protein n=1 Tax=uncultured Deinococcus sp. TaxID=158789 RepID=UPI0025CDED2F|nr:VC0807 family protein [uncultured Deinococcus sp.]